MTALVGVFDSGAGGLTVVRALRSTLPDCDIVYLGDTARVPYGTKSPRTVERYSLACQRFLLAHDISLVMVACNTASANALSVLRDNSPVPVIGAVDPGARSAMEATRNRHVGVIGTLSTVASRAYERAIRALDPEACVSAQACPLLVPLAEEGWTDDPIAVAVAERYLETLFHRDPEIDTLVLGCTHYPLLQDVLSRTADQLAKRSVAIVDSATAMVEAARTELGLTTAAGPPRGSLHCFATDTSRLNELGPRFLGEPSVSFELVDLGT